MLLFFNIPVKYASVKVTLQFKNCYIREEIVLSKKIYAYLLRFKKRRV